MILTVSQGTWESYATLLANAATDQELVDAYNKLAKDFKLEPESKGRVVFARDTRASGPHLVTALVDGLEASGTEHTDYKLLTTPQLHYITRCLNTKGTPYDYGEPTEHGYYQKMSDAYEAAMGYKKHSGGVTVDCANGVGGPKLQELLSYLPSPSEGGLDIKVVNDDVVRPERLNYQVGSVNVVLIVRLTSDSVVPTSSKLANGLHLRLSLDHSNVAVHLMVMLIELCTTLLTKTTAFIFLMAIA